MWLFLAGYLVKGAVLFHPAYFYNDVAQQPALRARRSGTGRAACAARNHAAQVQVGVAYPRVVAGRKYAFPYAPVFFLPFTLLPEEGIVRAIKHVALFCAAAEVVARLRAGAALLGRAPGGRGAAAVAVLLPPLYSRLLLAMWSTIAGHLLDTAVIVATARAGRTGRRAPAVDRAVAGTLPRLSDLHLQPLQPGRSSPASRAPRAAPAGRAPARRRWAVALTVAVLALRGLRGRCSCARSCPRPRRRRHGGRRRRRALGGVAARRSRASRIFYGWGYPGAGRGGLRGRCGAARAARALRRACRPTRWPFASLVALRAFAGGLFRT